MNIILNHARPRTTPFEIYTLVSFSRNKINGWIEIGNQKRRSLFILANNCCIIEENKKKQLQDKRSQFKHLSIKFKHFSSGGNVANEKFAKQASFMKRENCFWICYDSDGLKWTYFFGSWRNEMQHSWKYWFFLRKTRNEILDDQDGKIFHQTKNLPFLLITKNLSIEIDATKCLIQKENFIMLLVMARFFIRPNDF